MSGLSEDSGAMTARPAALTESQAGIRAAVEAASSAVSADQAPLSIGGPSELPPLQHALLGWATLWQFPAAAKVGVATALQVNKEIAAVSALLQCGDEEGGGGGVDEALLRNLLHRVRDQDGFQLPVKQFLAALQVRIQASFDLALESLNAKALALKAASPQEPVSVEAVPSARDSVEGLSETFRLQVEIERRKRSIKGLEADRRVHEALNKKRFIKSASDAWERRSCWQKLKLSNPGLKILKHRLSAHIFRWQ